MCNRTSIPPSQRVVIAALIQRYVQVESRRSARTKMKAISERGHTSVSVPLSVLVTMPSGASFGRQFNVEPGNNMALKARAFHREPM